MANILGIHVYEILENGNLLHGIYTNEWLANNNNYTIDLEIARKKKFDKKGVDGHYECRYMETDSSNNITGTFCSLEIVNNNGVYDFTWTKNNIIWKGIGLMAGTTHIAVSYYKP